MSFGPARIKTVHSELHVSKRSVSEILSVTNDPCCVTFAFRENEPTRRRAPDEVAEWLRRWTANPLCSERVGSNPILVEW